VPSALTRYREGPARAFWLARRMLRVCVMRAYSSLWMVMASPMAVGGCGGAVMEGASGTVEPEAAVSTSDAGTAAREVDSPLTDAIVYADRETDTKLSRDADVGCCKSDDECSIGKECINTECLAPQRGSCWRDADCPMAELCIGVRVCACNADCSFSSIPGRCVPRGSCCNVPNDCGDFVYQPCVNNKCIQPSLLPAGECWDDNNCNGKGRCVGAQVCPCGMLCDTADHPGTCQP